MTYKKALQNHAISSVALFFWAHFLVGLPAEAQIPADGKFRWRVSKPILEIDQDKLPKSQHRWIAVKDPSIVRYDKQWHLFCTLRKDKKGDGRIRIGYLRFDDWKNASLARWKVLELTMGYHGAPQIFYFRPHKKWYLIYQAEDQTRGLRYGPCFSTNADITKPKDWTKPEPIYKVPKGQNAGLDFWVICDEKKAHLFYTTLNGKMWRTSSSIKNFPNDGWSKPTIALKADIFEASHIYKIEGENRYITIVEAQGNNRRYFKAYVAESLDGNWMPLAGSKDKPLVSPVNVVNQDKSWATSYSHGEFIRTSHDETLTISPKNLELLFQGASDKEYRNRAYGQIPWRLGILKIAN